MTRVQANAPDAYGRDDILSMPKRSTRFELMRWIALVVAIYLVAVLVNLFVFNESWQWRTVWKYLFFPLVLGGVWSTIVLTVTALLGGLALGLIIAAARVSRFAVLRAASFAYVWFMRAIPPLALLLVVFYLGVLTPTLGIGVPFMPRLVEWPTNDVITPFMVAFLGLTLYLGGHSAEIFRSGWLAVPPGQQEAIKSLSLPPGIAFLRVTGPQAFRVIIPPLANDVVTMFKSTSLVSLVGFTELLTTVQHLYAVNFKPIPMLTVACIWYLLLTSLLMVGQIYLERHYARGFTRKAEKTTATVTEAIAIEANASSRKARR